MSRSRPTRRRRLVAGLAPFVLALGALPLLAPTCGGGGGVQTFARSSLIIPMDMCYQNQTDGVTGAPFSCPQAVDPGNVIRAYGLVYQLVRNNIAVYWVISPTKTALTGTDLRITYNNGFPVFLYDWNTGGTGAAPTAAHDITYIGGPFVVDGSDYARASAVLQNYRSLYGSVNVHVSNVAFTADVAKTMAGGWNAGGAVPPKLALLDIGSSGAGRKNSEFVIQGYLTQAGLDFAGASGTATGTHGQIFDRLLMDDFQPDASGLVTSTKLFRNGYQILWVPHWAAPSSCSDCAAGPSCTCNVPYTQAQIDQALRTIGAFSAAGKDVFAECAGLGSFDGVTGNNTYRTGASDGSTHFQTTAAAGVAGLSGINSGSGAYFWPGNFPSPFLQLGDFTFVPQGGAIADYTSTTYKPAETIRFVSHTSSASSYDVFTLVNRSGSHGTIAYLGGHSYSGNDGSFQIAGTRLVLNTLFNLGAGCVESGVACNTGLLGVCSQGVMRCDVSGRPVCAQVTAASAEVCDGLDNDCNGLVDDGLDRGCYDGPAATRNRGICRDGVSSCVRNPNGTYSMSACNGEVLPSAEVCNGLDDDCNGFVDDDPLATTRNPPLPAGSPLTQACYTGPQSSLDPVTSLPRGICKSGIQTCSSAQWSACPVCPANAWQTPASFPDCEILPQTETCGNDGQGNQVDMNCNGIVADGCGCTPGAVQSCYTGPSGTRGVGSCRAGTQTCVAGTPNSWGVCSGDVLPGALDCTKPPATPAADNNCNGVADYTEPGCNLCPPPGDPALVCYVNADHSPPQGTCRNGTRSCTNGVFGACSGVVLPGPEICDGQDNDCNGLVDDGATCAAGLSCVNGACVPTSCGVERPCPEGYQCNASNACVVANCGTTGAPCPAGAVCRFGQCADPCAGVTCGAGASCASGTCTGGGCYFAGCPSGQLCLNGACAADPCLGIVCPSGTFCRQGDCVQACVFQTCGAGQRCGIDGFCAADPCAGKTCAPDQICENGACVTDLCLGVGCGQGKVCQDGTCVDDPCSGIVCPAGQCLGGQCFSTENPLGLGPPPPAPKASSGCGCGSGAGSAFSALLLLLALPLARRRRGAPMLVLLAAVALGATACKHSDNSFDPSQCQETCGEQRCVDLRGDPLYCGSCTHACGAGEICVDATCGPAAAVAPYIASVNPPSAPKGAAAPVAVTLTGERFVSGATLRVIAPAGTTTYATTVPDSNHLSASLDFSSSATTSLSLRVVNPNRVISNALRFDVITPTPAIDGVTPTSISAGTTQALSVTGTGFVQSSLCHIKGPTVTDQALPTVSGATIACTLATSGLTPGAYELWIVNEGTLSSNHLPFQITSSGSHLTSLSPNGANAGETVSVYVTGSGFDAASTITFDGANQATNFVDPTHLLVPALVAPACGAPPCAHTVGVTNSTDTLPFTVTNGVLQVTALSVTPSPLYQGDTATLTFTATGLGATATTTVQPPVGAAITIPSCGTAPCTSVTAPGAVASVSLAGQPAGLYTATLTSGGITSSSFQFRVLSNVAVLQSASPAGGAQGTNPLTVTLTGSNFRGTAGARILFQGPGVNLSIVPATWTPPTGATVSLNLTGLDTGVYALAVQNPGAAASNQVSFSVTPGPPTVASVSPTSTVRQDAPVTVTMTGTNFAKPDANGNAASQVMVVPAGPVWAAGTAYAVGVTVLNGDNAYRCTVAGTSAGSGPGPTGTGSSIADGTVTWAWAGTWTPLTGSPVTVVSSTTIQIAFDTRTAVPGTYHIAVWNPPGPQKSNTNVTFTVNP